MSFVVGLLIEVQRLKMKFIKRIILYFVTISLTLVFGLYTYLLFGRGPSHFWRNVSDAKVTYQGKIIPDAHVYHQPDGKLLINMGERHEQYIYLPAERNVGLCNFPFRYIPLPGYTYVYDCGSQFCPYVLMDSAKLDIDAQVNKGERLVEFNSLNRERVNVSW